MPYFHELKPSERAEIIAEIDASFAKLIAEMRESADEFAQAVAATSVGTRIF